MTALLNMEFAILDFIAAHLTAPWLDGIMKFFSALGDSGFLWIAIGLAMLCWQISRRGGWAVLFSLAGCLVVGNLTLKPLIARMRPFMEAGVSIIIEQPSDYSFPSGHTMASFAAAFCLYRWNKKAGIAAYITAAIIAFSRMYLYVHYPTDILAGIVIGTAIGYGVCKVQEIWRLKRLSKGQNNKE